MNKEISIPFVSSNEIVVIASALRTFSEEMRKAANFVKEKDGNCKSSLTTLDDCNIVDKFVDKIVNELSTKGSLCIKDGKMFVSMTFDEGITISSAIDFISRRFKIDCKRILKEYPDNKLAQETLKDCEIMDKFVTRIFLSSL